MRRKTGGIRLWLAFLSLCGAGGLLIGCGPSGPGLVDKPPPKGGPPANSRRPPGEILNRNTR
jgi:hypothetical protein